MMKREVQMEEVSSDSRITEESDADPLIPSKNDDDHEEDDDHDKIVVLHQVPPPPASVGILRSGVAGCTEIEQGNDDDDDLKDDHRCDKHDHDVDDDLEAGSNPCCRICLESDANDVDEMISPCICKGTQQFVHRSCLDQWRSVKEGFAFSHCTTCKAQFHLRVQLFQHNAWRTFKFRIFVAKDILLVFLAVQTVIAAMGGLAYLMDGDGSFRNSFSDDWDRILSKHPIPFYYCIGFGKTSILTTKFSLIGTYQRCKIC